jgi:hypothetical protein
MRCPACGSDVVALDSTRRRCLRCRWKRNSTGPTPTPQAPRLMVRGLRLQNLRGVLENILEL